MDRRTLDTVNRPFSSRRVIAAVLAGVMAAGPASPVLAATPLRRGATAVSATAGTGGGSAPPAQPAAQAQRAAEMVGRSLDALRARALAQTSARAAAAAGTSEIEIDGQKIAIPNGLGVGGLERDLAGQWVGADEARQEVTGTGAGREHTQVTVKQTEQKAILEWKSFNIGKDTTLYFDQTAGGASVADWIALNRVKDPTLRPSAILGSIKADGQVYVVNPNGIIFGGGSQVNVHSLVATSLRLTDEQFRAGINRGLSIDVGAGNAYGLPQFGEYTTSTTGTWSPSAVAGDVSVQAGAELTTRDGGKVMLFAPHVANAGRIEAPGGQVILAAGEQVWLTGRDSSTAAPDQPRGFDVAVSAPQPRLWLISMANPLWDSGGQYENQIFPFLEARAAAVGYRAENTGEVYASHGNITMMGREVDQLGTLYASTSLSHGNGSITLAAYTNGLSGYESEGQPVTYPLYYLSTGTLRLGAGSVTEVMPDLADETRIEANAVSTLYQPGLVSLRGNLVDIQSGANVLVPSGRIEVVASATTKGVSAAPDSGEAVDDGSRIYLGEDAYLSVAGLQDVFLAMEANSVQGELRVNELRDSPLYKESWLRGATDIWVDRRVTGTFTDGPMSGVNWVSGAPGKWVGTPLADFTGWIGLGKVGIGELSTAGGSILLKSSGSLVTRQGSLLDVSGGSVRYGDGYVKTTQLIGADGRIYDIGEATPDRLYVGIFAGAATVHERWGTVESWGDRVRDARSGRFEEGQTEGRSAGSIQLYVADGTALEGSIWGGVIVGGAQAAKGTAPRAGSLRWGGTSPAEGMFLPGELVVSRDPLRLADGFDAVTPLPADFWQAAGGGLPAHTRTSLDAEMLEESGLASIQLYPFVGFQVAAGSDLDLARSSSLSVNTSGPIALASSIRIRGGQLSLSTSGALTTAPGVALDVSGEWVNDLTPGGRVDTPTIDGGRIQLGGALQLAAGTVLDVSGGGWLDDRGTKQALHLGNAGQLVLGTADGYDLAALDLRAFAAGSSGTLELTTSRQVRLGGATTGDGVLTLPADLFGAQGFGRLNLTAKQDLAVPEGVEVAQVPVSIDLLGVDLAALPTGASLPAAGHLRVLPLERRVAHAPSLLHLEVRGDVAVGAGATLRGDVGGSIVLTATRHASAGGVAPGHVTVAGAIEAPAGGITLTADEIALEPGAALLARGMPVISTDVRDRRVGKVLPGGSVSLSGALTLAAGSLIDVSGASGEIDDPQGRQGGRVTLASNGGAISLEGSGLVEATLVASAGGPGASGGSISFTTAASEAGAPRQLLLDSIGWLDPDCYGYTANGACDNDPRDVIGFDIGQILRDYGYDITDPMIISPELLAALPAGAQGRVIVSASRPLGGGDVDPEAYGWTAAGLDLMFNDLGIDLGGITASAGTVRPLVVRPGSISDQVGSLLFGGPVELDGVELSALYSIGLNAGVVNGAGNDSALRAPYLSLGGDTGSAAAAAGKLSLEASKIALGAGAIRGFAATELVAADVSLGWANEETLFQVDGALVVRAAQLYPETGAKATLAATERLQILPKGTAEVPLSAAGQLTLQAPEIDQGGVVRAPHGTITLDAAEKLTLRAGSITSVSGEGIYLPYGTLANGETWQDPYRTDAASGGAPLVVTAPPEKRVTLDAPSVDIAEGSTVDIRGGGDLYAWEFVAGPGGSHDVLAMAGTYAILPWRGSGPSAQGQRIWLDGGGGIDAGWYELLPARYAALPGAYAVSMVKGSTGLPPGDTYRLSDGTLVMAGRLGDGLDGSADALASAWRVMSGGVIRSYSEYNEAFASGFFSSDAFKLSQYRLTGQEVATPRLPRDGGSAVFRAGEEISIEGQLLSAAAEGGRGGLLDIAGARIAVVGAGQDVSDLQGYLLLDSAELTGFGASSLLVGGTRSGDAQGLRLDVTADRVVVRNDASSALAGPEIVLAAADEVAVGAGSVIEARGEVAGGAGNLVVTPQTATADRGALLRVSNGDAVTVLRQHVDSTEGGLVTIGEGATVSGGKALLLDATRTSQVARSAALIGQDITLSSGRIGIGGGEGLVLDEASLARWAGTTRLTLRSYGAIDVFQGIDLGGAGLADVTLDSAGLVGHTADAVAIRSATLRLVNSGSTLGVPSDPGSGALTLAADEVVLGRGGKSLVGFATVELGGARRIVGEGTGSLDAGAAGLVLETPVLTGRASASQAVTTAGALAVTGGGDPGAGGDESLGASLSLTGRSVSVASSVVARAGAIHLTASGGDVALASGSRLDVGGVERRFYDAAEHADAGTVSLTAVGGDVRLAAGSAVDVSGHANGGGAGTLAVTASGGGTAVLDGQLLATAAAGERGGSFSLDEGALADFATLAGKLNAAGFVASRQLRIRTGDVVLTGETTVADFGLVADQGAVTVAGSIDARAAYGGKISISAGDGLVMNGGASLRAGSTTDLGGGRVTLEAAGGELDVQGGTIDVSGGEGGRVRFRAAQTSDHEDVHVTRLAARVVGARSAVLEGVATYDAPTVSAVKPLAITEANTFSAAAATVARRLGLDVRGPDDGAVAVMPGIEIRSAGDLTVDADWNLFADFGAAREGGLTLRAAGDLLVNGNISDGFDLATRTGVYVRADGEQHVLDAVLQDSASWDLRLVAGADLGSASALTLQSLAALAAGKGTLTVGQAGAGKLVRTGTGDLQVRAGRDLALATHESAIYTAGRKDTETWDDFTQEPLYDIVRGVRDYDAVWSSPTFAVGGGDLDVATQGDVKAIIPDGTGQLFGDWLRREGAADPAGLFRDWVVPGFGTQDAQQSAWWVEFGRFQHGVGALGGGNVSLRSGGDVVDLTVAMPTSGRVRGGTTPDERKLLELRNGGSLDVVAGGAIRGGQYYLGRGEGTVAARELTTGRTLSLKVAPLGTSDVRDLGSRSIAPVLALGDASLQVSTQGDLRVETVLDPLMVEQPRYSNHFGDPQRWGSYMLGYTDRTSLDLVAVGGDLVLANQSGFLARSIDDTGHGSYAVRPSLWSPDAGDAANLYPSETRLSSLSGDVRLVNDLNSSTTIMRLMAGASGELRILAAGDVTSTLTSVVEGRNLPALLPTPLRPGGSVRTGSSVPALYHLLLGRDQYGNPIENPEHLVQEADVEPSRIYALGSIVDTRLAASEQLWMRAGKDIRGFSLNLRNLHPTDVSWLDAGNDVLATGLVGGTVDVQGAGALLLTAGRDVYGNLSATTSGNRTFDGKNEPVAGSEVRGLPAQGASIEILAGLAGRTPSYEALREKYLDPLHVAEMPGHLTTTVRGETVPLYLVDAYETRNGVEKRTRVGLVSFVAGVTGEILSPLDAWARFQTLPRLTQERFLRQVYVQELQEAAVDQYVLVAGHPRNGGVNRGYAAIESLFPGSSRRDDTSWSGDVALDTSTLRTNAGGDIQILTPGGGLQLAALNTSVASGAGAVVSTRATSSSSPVTTSP